MPTLDEAKAQFRGGAAAAWPLAARAQQPGNHSDHMAWLKSCLIFLPPPPEDFAQTTGAFKILACFFGPSRHLLQNLNI